MTAATLLIVEDDGILAADLEIILTGLGYRILGPVATGEEAIGLLQGQSADLVLMDIELAGELNGIETAQHLGHGHDIPVVFLSGFSQDPLLDQAKVVAPYGYLIKPVSERELAATVAMSLHRHALDRQLKESRKALEASEQRHRHYLQSTPYCVFAVNGQGRFLQVNPSACRITGFSENELLTMGIADVLLEVDREAGRHHFQKVVDEGRAEEELLFRTKGGERRWWSITVVKAEKDRYLGFCNDITERRKAEESIRQRELFLRSVVETTAEGFWVIDAGGRVSEVNEAYCAMSGFSKEEILGKHINEIDIEETPAQTVERIQRIIAGGKELFETRHRRKDGGSFPLEVSVAFLPEQGGQFVCFCRDLSERKRMEEERNRLQAQLVHAQKMESIGTLAGGIAHDFNNILGAVLGYAEMAREDSPPRSAAVQSLDRVLEAGKRAASLVKQILAFSRQQDSKRFLLIPGPIIKEVAKLLRPMLPSTIAIVHRIDSTRSVLADPTQLHQVLMNLATNAFHAMEQTGGKLEITVDDVEFGEADLAVHPGIIPGSFVLLSVADTGPGISPEIKSRIFDPYFTTKEVGKGTGMGLAIVDGIVRGSGGFITCESDPGTGTVFTLALPAFEGEDADKGEDEELDTNGAGRILLVDDEELLVNMVRSMLERLGYQVTAHTSSSEALATFINDPHSFDAVVTDQTMPGMTGLDLARRLLQIRSNLPVILCTGYSHLVNEAQAKAYGIKGFAMKPLTQKAIATLLKQVMK